MLAVLLLNRMTSMATRRRIKKQEKIEICVEIVPQTSDDSYCRTCLGTEDLVPIFSEDRTEEKRSRELKVTTGLQIKKNDGLSQRICGGCIESLNQALKFRRKSKKAEKTLLNRISDKKPKKKYTKSSKPKKTENEFEVNITEYTDNDYEDGFQDDVDFKQEDEPVQIKQEKIEVKKSPRVKRKLVGPGPSSYKCNICNKEFRMKATYKAHMRFHTNYCVCESCGKRCRNNNQLQEHKRARHGLGRIHKCAYCEYSSATKEALTIHERRHTGERPYICDHCGATFHRRSNLVQHIAIHLPEKNFQCDMCPKRLKSKKFLQIHKHNAHTGKRYGYLCPICEHRFEKPNKVRAHSRRVHGLDDHQQGPVVRVQL